MTIAHVSDTHLGFRAFGRTAPSGANQREEDVMRTFQACLDAIAERDPDLVVHAGDFFHVVRPSNVTIVLAFTTLNGFQTRRKGKPFVLIGGNHDTPRTSESGNILSLFAGIPGVRLLPNRVQSVEFPELDCEVVGVPSNGLHDQPSVWSPKTSRKHSVLSLHGMAAQALPDAAQFDLAQTRHDRWSYVALGDYHSFRTFGDNVGYSGSTDFTSTNIWDELRTPKGWVWFDTERPGLELVPLATRPVIELPTIDANGLEAEEIERQMRQNAKWDRELMPIVRQRIINLHPSLRGKFGMDIRRDLNLLSLNYQVATFSSAVNNDVGRAGSGVSQSLEDTWREFAAGVDWGGGITVEEAREEGLRLLNVARDQAPI